MNFEFHTATRIVFGPGAVNGVGEIAKELGRRALVVTGRDVRRAEGLSGSLASRAMSVTTFSVPGEPEISTVEQGTRLAKAENCEFVIGMGGGSVLDAGKAIAAMLAKRAGRPVKRFVSAVWRAPSLLRAARCTGLVVASGHRR